MAINEAYNVDCIEYMRTLPDNCFDLAVCDPPYGSGNNPKLGGAERFGERFRRYFKPEQVSRRSLGDKIPCSNGGGVLN